MNGSTLQKYLAIFLALMKKVLNCLISGVALQVLVTTKDEKIVTEHIIVFEAGME